VLTLPALAFFEKKKTEQTTSGGMPWPVSFVMQLVAQRREIGVHAESHWIDNPPSYSGIQSDFSPISLKRSLPLLKD
jgi:hypothetical protein